MRCCGIASGASGGVSGIAVTTCGQGLGLHSGVHLNNHVSVCCELGSERAAWSSITADLPGSRSKLRRTRSSGEWISPECWKARRRSPTRPGAAVWRKAGRAGKIDCDALKRPAFRGKRDVG